MYSPGRNHLVGYRLPLLSKIEIQLENLFAKEYSSLSAKDLLDNVDLLENRDFKMIISSSTTSIIDIHSLHLGHFAVAMDGVFINHKSLIEKLLNNNELLRNKSSEEALASLFVHESKTENSWYKLIKSLLTNYPGGYSFMVMTKDKIYASRDCYGIKPLVLGTLNDTNYVIEYDVEDGKPILKPKTPNIIASDSVILNKINAKYVRQVLPGEIIELSETGIKSLGICYRTSGNASTMCSMEYVSIAHSSTLLEDQRIQNVRFQLGKAAAQDDFISTDCVTTLPNISWAFLLGFAQVSQLKIVEAFYYINMSNNDSQLNIYNENVDNKSLTLLVDSQLNPDLKNAILLLKQSGAKEVHLHFCSPDIRSNCPFGIGLEYSDSFSNNFSSIKYLKLEMLMDVISKDIEGKEVRNVGHCFHCFGRNHAMLKF